MTLSKHRRRDRAKDQRTSGSLGTHEALPTLPRTFIDRLGLRIPETYSDLREKVLGWVWAPTHNRRREHDRYDPVGLAGACDAEA
jgi:hypothetical protein